MINFSARALPAARARGNSVFGQIQLESFVPVVDRTPADTCERERGGEGADVWGTVREKYAIGDLRFFPKFHAESPVAVRNDRQSPSLLAFPLEHRCEGGGGRGGHREFLRSRQAIPQNIIEIRDEIIDGVVLPSVRAAALFERLDRARRTPEAVQSILCDQRLGFGQVCNDVRHDHSFVDGWQMWRFHWYVATISHILIVQHFSRSLTDFPIDLCVRMFA